MSVEKGSVYSLKMKCQAVVLFGDLKPGLLFQRRLFGEITDPRVTASSREQYPHISSEETAGFMASLFLVCLG